MTAPPQWSWQGDTRPTTRACAPSRDEHTGDPSLHRHPRNSRSPLPPFPAAVFLASDCGACVGAGFAFCSEAASTDYVTATNASGVTVTTTVQEKSVAGLGSGFCWSADARGLTNNDVQGVPSLLGSTDVTASLDCDRAHLYMRQCNGASIAAALRCGGGGWLTAQFLTPPVPTPPSQSNCPPPPLPTATRLQ